LVIIRFTCKTKKNKTVSSPLFFEVNAPANQGRERKRGARRERDKEKERARERERESDTILEREKHSA
jgi:hypothetical protein